MGGETADAEGGKKRRRRKEEKVGGFPFPLFHGWKENHVLLGRLSICNLIADTGEKTGENQRFPY
jgi:hypothetical protein